MLFLLPLCLALAGCGGSDSAFARFLQADARPSDPSARVQFGRGKLPGDFPGGLPMLPHAAVLGWQRTTADTSLSWELVYEAPGDTSTATSTIRDGLRAAGWQITDTNSQNGFQQLNVSGSGANAGDTGVIDIGPAVTNGRVDVVEEVGRDR
jgi:hypothetical protein